MKKGSTWDGFPAVIKVGHRDFRTEFRDREWSDRQAATGQCSNDQGLIELAEHMTGTLAAEVVLHEVLHATWAVWQINDEDNQERTISALGAGLTAVFRDNPQLMKWLSVTTQPA